MENDNLKQAEQYLNNRGITQKMGKISKHPSDLLYMLNEFAQQQVKNLNIPDYEYEMFIDDEGIPFEINTWIPISTDRIKDLSRINEYIEKGLIRKRK